MCVGGEVCGGREGGAASHDAVSTMHGGATTCVELGRHSPLVKLLFSSLFSSHFSSLFSLLFSFAFLFALYLGTKHPKHVVDEEANKHDAPNLVCVQVDHLHPCDAEADSHQVVERPVACDLVEK